MSIKQVIIIRKDLNMRKGKMAAQAAHASMKVILDRMIKEDAMDGWVKLWSLSMNFDSDFYEWLSGSFKKIVVGINSEKELMDLYIEAQIAGLPCALIQDSGLTEFHGDPTYTAMAIGPAKSEEIDKITGTLELL
jgi:PTH2 family peptidyl-tRNA hydrolase